MSNLWANKHVFITGVCGTVGHEVLRQLIERGCKRIVGIDNNESDLFFLNNTYRDRPDINLRLGDLRDLTSLTKSMADTDIVLHCAALKHVILCEEAPRQAVQTNILGTQNVIDAALSNNVERVLFTSSDKAVNPTNVMGTSKLMGERLLTSANAIKTGSGPIFACTRFGNVLGSRGSVIPIFAKQIKDGGPVTLTDPTMTRFIMTIEEAVRLVLESVFLAKGGEVFVTKMPILRIEDLAKAMINVLAPRYGHDPKTMEIKVIGVKAGEKLYEELMNEEEVRRTLELKHYFAITPAFKSVYDTIEYTYNDELQKPASRVYNSSAEAVMTIDEIVGFLDQANLLNQEN